MVPYADPFIQSSSLDTLAEGDRSSARLKLCPFLISVLAPYTKPVQRQERDRAVKWYEFHTMTHFFYNISHFKNRNKLDKTIKLYI